MDLIKQVLEFREKNKLKIETKPQLMDIFSLVEKQCELQKHIDEIQRSWMKKDMDGLSRAMSESIFAILSLGSEMGIHEDIKMNLYEKTASRPNRT